MIARAEGGNTDQLAAADGPKMGLIVRLDVEFVLLASPGLYSRRSTTPRWDRQPLLLSATLWGCTRASS